MASNADSRVLWADVANADHTQARQTEIRPSRHRLSDDRKLVVVVSSRINQEACCRRLCYQYHIRQVHTTLNADPADIIDLPIGCPGQPYRSVHLQSSGTLQTKQSFYPRLALSLSSIIPCLIYWQYCSIPLPFATCVRSSQGVPKARIHERRRQVLLS